MIDNQTANTMNPTPPPGNNIFKKLLTKKVVFAIIGVVVLAEVIWASWTLLKGGQNALPLNIPTQTQVVEKEAPTTITLTSPSSSIKLGDKINVSVNISSPKNTQGADIIINFDPKVLSVETIGTKKEPMVLSGIYSEYPVNKLEDGQITVSGISSSQGGGVVTNGLFGSISFVAKSVGETEISVEFAPGGTTDSNVIQAEIRKDALSSVSNLNLTILP